MATAASVSELRMVLLGNSWSQMCFVGNLILGTNAVDSKIKLEFSIKVGGPVKDKIISIVWSPELLQPELSADRLTELITEITEASAPGPHVFLLVLQPEDFTEQHKTRLQSVLERFSEQAFDHSLVLISPPRNKLLKLSDILKQHPPLNDIVKRCKENYLKISDLRVPKLITQVEQIIKNKRKHVSCNTAKDVVADFTKEQTSEPRELPTKSIDEECGRVCFQKQNSPHRIALFGKHDDKKQTLIRLIFENKIKWSSSPGVLSIKHCVTAHGTWRGKPLVVVMTPDLFSLSVEAVREEMKRCVSLCSPGPNVLLLLVKPSDFTENNRQTLNFILSLFGPDAFKHSMVVFTGDDNKKNIHIKELISDCEGRYYIKSDKKHVVQHIEDIVCKNGGSFLTVTDKAEPEKMKKMKPSLSLVLCGRRGAEKTSAAESILGRTGRPAASSPEQCVKHQGEVCGRWVSLVELPALSGKPLEAVMQQCLSCISLCGPEGVHAFILVLPVAPLTDEDKAELKTIQDTFSSRVHPFTMILFTVDSTLSVDDFIEKDNNLQELCENCGGRYLTFNICGDQDVYKLLDSVEAMMSRNKPCSYTTETFAQAQIEKITALQNKLHGVKPKTVVTCDQDEKSQNSLKIVLIGKTGSGKSTSGNTILGRKEFKAELSQKSVTKVCQKAEAEVDGRRVSVVDTPGLFDTNMSNKNVVDEMLNCISLLAPGPHVFLLVLQIGRFTQEEEETLKLIKMGFGKGAEKFTIILFTHGDALKNESIKDFIEKCDNSFKKLISDCGNRYHVFNNEEKRDHTQVKDLIKKIDDLVKENGGGCYTNDMLQKAEAAIKKEMERILKEKEEEMRREREELERKYQQEIEEMKLKMDKQREKTEKERQQREKELKEKEEKIKAEKELRKKEQKMRAEEDRKRKEQEERERKEWERKYKDLEEKIKSEEESKETFDRKRQESRRQMEEEREQREKERKEKREQDEEKRQEEERKLKKLQDEYEQEREKYNKQMEENQMRQEQEEKERTQLEEEHRKQVEELKREYEEKARKQAEEFNEFIEKKMEDFDKNIKELQDEMHNMQKKYEETLNQKETDLNDITKLHQKQKQETGDTVIILLTQKKENKEKISSMKKKHKRNLEKCEDEITCKYKSHEKEELKKLKKKQMDELNEFGLKTKDKDALKEKKKDLNFEHELETNELKSKLLSEFLAEKTTETTKLKKKQEQELTDFTQKLLEENDKNEKEQMAKLQKKHDQEMKELRAWVERQQDESCREELEDLQKEHDKEIKNLREKLLTPEKNTCFVS